MKWNEGGWLGALRRALSALAVAALGASTVAALQPRLSAAYHQVRVTSDLYALPAPEQTVVASLGYRAALADLIWAHVLVDYGMHFQEKRRFEFVGDYLDTINALDPKFSEPYRLADTLLTLQPEKPRLEDYRKARQVLERGMRELPDYAELWLTAGQFLAYLAPPWLGDDALKAEWRLEGARRLARACELQGSNQNISYHCITAAGLFSRAGNREATRQFAERVLAVSDNPEIRDMALGYLRSAATEQQRDQIELWHKRFQDLWAKDLSFISKALLLVIGPPHDPAECAGVNAALPPIRCASSWRAWDEAISAEAGFGGD